LRRVIQKQLTDRLALALFEGKLREGDQVTVEVIDGELSLQASVAAAESAAATGARAPE
jgi:ATP-dependent Clp protease ATP-binding subunit ClpA